MKALTPLARQGIFRFFPGVNNGNADFTPSGAGSSRVAPGAGIGVVGFLRGHASRLRRVQEDSALNAAPKTEQYVET
jgi:hypothetical protein